MNYNTTARRIVDRAIKDRCLGIKFTKIRLNSEDVNETVLSHYILRRAPKFTVLFDMTHMNQTRVVVIN